MDVLIVGATGLVGSNVREALTENGHEVSGTYYTSSDEDDLVELDKTNVDRTLDLIETHDPDVVVDTAAFHAVDDCETDRERAWRVNATGTRNVAIGAKSIDAHLIYVSTDYVFPGDTTDSPYEESDPVDPVNYYAQTKYAGEQAAKVASATTVLRSSVIYGAHGQNFVTWALSELEAGNEIRIVDDQVASPTYAPDLARACVAVIEKELTGLYHAAGPQALSRYEFTVELAESYGYDPDRVVPVTSDELGQTAPRPRNSTLDSSSLYADAEVEFRSPEAAFEAARWT